MKLKDLIESRIFKDTDIITVSKPLQGCGADFRKGNWYQNQILDFMNLEIKCFSWDDTNGFSISLKGEKVKAKEISKIERNKRGQVTYLEYSDGFWTKKEYDDNGNETNYENSTGYWAKKEYDDNDNQVYYENSTGYWEKMKYDDNDNQTYYENSTGYWEKWEYDDNGHKTYYKNSTGYGYWEKYKYD